MLHARTISQPTYHCRCKACTACTFFLEHQRERERECCAVLSPAHPILGSRVASLVIIARMLLEICYIERCWPHPETSGHHSRLVTNDACSCSGCRAVMHEGAVYLLILVGGPTRQRRRGTTGRCQGRICTLVCMQRDRTDATARDAVPKSQLGQAESIHPGRPRVGTLTRIRNARLRGGELVPGKRRDWCFPAQSTPSARVERCQPRGTCRAPRLTAGLGQSSFARFLRYTATVWRAATAPTPISTASCSADTHPNLFGAPFPLLLSIQAVSGQKDRGHRCASPCTQGSPWSKALAAAS